MTDPTDVASPPPPLDYAPLPPRAGVNRLVRGLVVAAWVVGLTVAGAAVGTGLGRLGPSYRYTAVLSRPLSVGGPTPLAGPPAVTVDEPFVRSALAGHPAVDRPAAAVLADLDVQAIGGSLVVVVGYADRQQRRAIEVGDAIAQAWAARVPGTTLLQAGRTHPFVPAWPSQAGAAAGLAAGLLVASAGRRRSRR